MSPRQAVGKAVWCFFSFWFEIEISVHFLSVKLSYEYLKVFVPDIDDFFDWESME